MCRWASKNVLGRTEGWNLMLKTAKVSELLWEAKLQSHHGDHRMQALIKSSQCTFPQPAKHSSGRAPEPVKPQSTGKSCVSSRANNVTVTSLTRDPGRQSSSPCSGVLHLGRARGEREAEWPPHISPLLWQKENPDSPLTFSTVTFYLGDNWPLGCAVLFTCQKHLSKQGKQF